MEEIIRNWKAITSPDFKSIAEDIGMQHQAVQFIAYVANHYIPKKEDDSHTTMRWEPLHNCYTGQSFRTNTGKFVVAVSVNPLEISIRNGEMKPTHRFSMEQKTKEEVMEWLTDSLFRIGLDTKAFDDQLHFSIPENKISAGGSFSYSMESNAQELIRYRDNSHLLLEHFAAKFQSAEPVYVWPHHFDEGCYVPLEKVNNEVTRSLNFGMAIPDTMYESAYFYVTSRSNDGIDYDDLPDIEPPGEWHTGDWNGQALPLSSLLPLDRFEQAETVSNFMQQAIQNARRLAGWSYAG